MKKNTDDHQQQDVEKLNLEIEEELLYILENGKTPHEQNEQETNNYSYQTIFQYSMTIVLAIIVVINIALIIYKLFW